LFRPGFVNSAGIIRKKLGAEGRNPDDIVVRIIGPPSGIIILQMFFSRVGVFECNEPATCSTFFTLHAMFSYMRHVIKNSIPCL
jgi:hypothetical protein